MSVCVIIPTYNNAQTLEHVVAQTLQQGLPVIVVNDGSTDHTAEILERFDHITVISYIANKGKGNALLCGFKKALDLGYDYAVTLDSDGQHNPENIPRFIEKLNETGHCLIVGERNMNQNGIPVKSNFGRKFSNFWFWVETGVKNNDTQSGFRLYPLKDIAKKRFFTSKFEFEIESIVRLAWDQVPVASVPVEVTYRQGNERVSHFRPYRDFARISLLNTVLVMLAFIFYRPRSVFLRLKKKSWKELLFNPGESSLKKSLSIGFGVFMGIVPIWGFQMLVAFTLAIPLKLNKTLVLIASNISIPPMIPFIVFLSLWTGSIVLDTGVVVPYHPNMSIAGLGNMFLQYAAGACIFAAIAGFCTFGLFFLLLQTFRKKQIKS